MNFRTHLCVLLAVVAPGITTAEVYEMPPPGSDVVGAITVVQSRADETLLEIARRHGLGYCDRC